MNTTSFMDKQVMDLSKGSSTTQSKDFIDLMNHPQQEEEDQSGHGGNGNGIDKKEDIFPSYDFHPIHPFIGVGSSPPSSNFDSVPSNLGGSARSWNSAESKPKTSSPIRNYGSLDSMEPAKAIIEKDRNALDSALVAEIDRTVKKHSENLLHVLEGVSARLTQLESRTRHLENSVDDLKMSVGNNHGSTDGVMKQLENVLREVHTGVQSLKDKHEIIEAQLQLSKLQVSKVDQQPEPQKMVHGDSAQQVASAPQQSHQQLPPHVNIPPSHPTFSPPNAPAQQGVPHSVQPQNQFPQNQISFAPPEESYFPAHSQTQDAPNQQYQIPPSQQPLPPPAAPTHQQFQPTPQPQFSQPPPQQSLQHPTLAPVNPSQLQPSTVHHSEEPPYIPPQTYPPTHREPPSQQQSVPLPSQQFYGTPSHVYETPSSRSGSGFSSGYGPPPVRGEPYHYGGMPSQYGNTPVIKPHQVSSPTAAQSGGSGYPQLPTARVLPQALPAASGVSGGSGSSGSGNRVPIDDVVDRVTNMGFPRDHVRATVRKLTENNQAVDLNVVLDKLMNEGEVQPPRGWFGR
ncbi:protein transport protein sec31 [Ziziphus jujuba]|uniref:Protein transport protein sec31 n=1 Tax=Ziziphus jujuba TaxID=326968 RepID=A0A6P3ZUY8_ZIZJJ|nr:protein transport protein sec31 [Ziziphus jujuba]